MADVHVRREGLTLFVVELLTEQARTWGQEHIPEDAAWMHNSFVCEHRFDAAWMHNSFVCEHRFIADIVQGMQGDGLEVT